MQKCTSRILRLRNDLYAAKSAVTIIFRFFYEPCFSVANAQDEDGSFYFDYYVNSAFCDSRCCIKHRSKAKGDGTAAVCCDYA